MSGKDLGTYPGRARVGALSTAPLAVMAPIKAAGGDLAAMETALTAAGYEVRGGFGFEKGPSGDSTGSSDRVVRET